MAKRTNRMAWGLAVLMAVVVLVGGGVLLTRGVKLGNVAAVAYGLEGWEFGTASTIEFHEDDLPRQVDALCLGPFGVRIERPWSGSSTSIRSGTGR